jgi:hypothetical protein
MAHVQIRLGLVFIVGLSLFSAMGTDSFRRQKTLSTCHNGSNMVAQVLSPRFWLSGELNYHLQGVIESPSLSLLA